MTPRVSALLLLLCVLLVSAAPLTAAEPQADRCVILISIDGLAHFYLDDPKADMPTLRRLAREGARADGMVCSFPTVTWPNHTTLVTGVEPARHGVIGNSVFDRETGRSVPYIPDPLFDKDEIVRTPTIYDVAHAAGLKTAAIVWPATRNAKTLDFTVPDMKGNESWEQFGTAAWLDELRAAGLPVDRYGPWVESPSGGVQRDWLYARMTAHLLENHSPNLVLLHLVEADHVQHRYGPRTGDAYWSMSYSDDRIRDVFEAVQRSPMKDRTTIIVCSDHGFFPISREIRPNVLLKKLGLAPEGQPRLAASLAQGGGCGISVLVDNETERARIITEIRDALRGVEGVQAVITAERFAELGQPTREQNPHAPDLWLAAESEYSFSDSNAGEDVVVPRSSPGGTHGYLPDQPDMLGLFVMWGHGVKPGTRLPKISNLDVAPTMARLLGVTLPEPDGRVLEEALRP